LVRTPSNHARASIEALERSRLVEYAERDALRRPQEFLPSDPSFPQQFAVGGGAWGWYKTHATQAWEITKGSASVVVAVLDTGLITNGLADFDGQTVPGWNVMKKSTDTSSSATDHGTYVAGVAGLAFDNGIGNAGFCPGCKIMPVQVGTSSGAYDADLAAGMVWAADHGARVINLSWAGPGASSTLTNAVNYARSKGVVVVAAAGNTNCDCPNYPAATPGVIGVAGTSTTDAKQGDSNYGTWVKIAAPEGNMTAWPSINGGPGYSPVGGTSLASPVVAGIAGLLFSAKPSLSGSEVEQALVQSATPVAFPVASGRVDALAALQLLGFPASQPASAPANFGTPQIMLETNGDRNYTPLTSSPQAGQVLLRGQGSWSGSAPLSLSAVKWLRCDSSGSGCTLVGTTKTYTVQTADAGSTIKLTVTVKNDVASTTASSALSPPVGGGSQALLPPTNTARPAITGTPEDGQVLSVSVGSWSGSPTNYSYRWLRCDSSGAGCAPLSGATASSYRLAPADVGHAVTAVVTASNSAGSADAQAMATSAVSAIAPLSLSLPSINGSDAIGQILQASPGAWSGTVPLAYGYQWQRCDSSGSACVGLAGATGNSFALTPADLGATMRVLVSASNSAGTTIAASQPTAQVTSGSKTSTFTGTLNKNLSSVSFPVTSSGGAFNGQLTFAKASTMTIELLDRSGTVVMRASGTYSPLGLVTTSLAAGEYTFRVSGSGFKGSISFTLTVTEAGP
jgi:hypothetical protein